VRAYRRGFSIREVPISHAVRGEGSSHIYQPSRIPFVLLSQLKGLVRLYANLTQPRFQELISQFREP
jgi:hypothetical protein